MWRINVWCNLMHSFFEMCFRHSSVIVKFPNLQDVCMCSWDCQSTVCQYLSMALSEEVLYFSVHMYTVEESGGIPVYPKIPVQVYIYRNFGKPQKYQNSSILKIPVSEGIPELREYRHLHVNIHSYNNTTELLNMHCAITYSKRISTDWVGSRQVFYT